MRKCVSCEMLKPKETFEVGNKCRECSFNCHYSWVLEKYLEPRKRFAEEVNVEQKVGKLNKKSLFSAGGIK